jgi:hypothetical protein
MMENCGACRADYALTAANAGVVVYLGYLPASHVWATCTHCQERETMYCAPATLADLTRDQGFGVVIETEPSAERRTAADAAWGKHRAARRESGADGAPGPADGGPGVTVEPAELPELPRQWMRQLHDDLRAFGSGRR